MLPTWRTRKGCFRAGTEVGNANLSPVAASGPDEEAPPRRPGHIVQIGKQTLVYGLSGVSLQLVGLITLPIFGRVFTPSDYGVLELATVGSSIAITLVDAGMVSASQ